MKIQPNKPIRTQIDLSDDAVARAWVKKLGKSKKEIAATIEKVGTNVETVKRELGLLGKEKTDKDADGQSNGTP